MPECKSGKKREDLRCPNCMKEGTVTQTSHYLQCCGFFGGCGFGSLNIADFWSELPVAQKLGAYTETGN